MAKQVTVTWTDPNPTTNLDHLEVWRKTGSGGTYAQVGADVATGVESLVDNNGGSGLADGQEYFYQVRAYNASGGYSYVESNITISSSQFALVLGANDGVKIPVAVSNTMDLEFVIDDVLTASTNKYMVGNGVSTSTNGHFGVVNNNNAAYYNASAYDADGLWRGLNGAIALNDNAEHTLRYQFSGVDTLTVTIDGNSFTPRDLNAFDFTTAASTGYIALGSFNDSPALGNAFTLKSFTLNGETFNVNEGSGSTITGSLGTVCPILGSTYSWVSI